MKGVITTRTVDAVLEVWRNKERGNQEQQRELRAFTTDTTSQLDVLGHNGNPLGVDGTQVGVFEQSNKVSLRSFLKSRDGRRLEPQVSLELLGNLTDQTLEGQLPDQQLGGLLEPPDLTESDGTRLKTVRLLDTSRRRRGLFAGSLGGNRLTRSLSSSRLTGGLLCTSHFGC